ncbi:MAG TPA: MATE family efflux transporter [Rhizomicrobium sp.]|jgi:MATE family multidrug resistance protein|nr:MATE family efflux transporter [Rhizomicrobium sp.]
MSDIAEFDLAHAGRPVTGHGLDAWFAEARELSKLAAPLVLTQLAQMAILTTDVIMLGRLGKTALASAALGNTVFFFTWLIGCGPVAAVAPMVAHILGAQPGNRAGVRNAVRMGFWAMLLLSAPLIVFLLFTQPVLLALGQRPELAAGAGRFTSMLCWGLPFSLGYQVLRNFSTALSRPNASLWAMGLGIFFNAAGDYALIFGHFGLPGLGLVGAGISSACSYAFAFFVMLGVVRLMPALHKFRIFRRFHRPHWDKLVEVFRLGMPIGLTMIFEAMLFNAATLIMGTFGTASVAAHQIALNVPSITFMVPLGVGMAATVRVGRAAGAGDGDGIRRAGYSALIMGAAFMSMTAILLWMFPSAIANLYFADDAANADVIVLAVVFLRVAAAFQICDGLQVVGALSLRGLKDAHMPMWIAGLSYWLAGFPVCLWLAFGWHLKGLGIWIGLATGLFVAAALMCWRFWFLSRAR